MNIFMATTVHIPSTLLKSVDRRAKALGVSRNRLIVRALEDSLRDRSHWSPEFLRQLRMVGPDVTEAMDELVAAVKGARRSKRPPAL